MCEVTEDESMERRLDSLAAEVDWLRDANAILRLEAGRLRSEAATLGRRSDAACEVADRLEAERDAALLGLGRVLSGADAARPTDGELVACAREFIGLDAAPAGEEGGGS